MTEEDLNSLLYFHSERGDVTRWFRWEKFRVLNQEVGREYDKMIAAEKVFTEYLQGLTPLEKPHEA